MERTIPCDAGHGNPNTSPSHVSLRPLDLSDVDDFMVWASDERVARFCTWDPCASKEDAMIFIRDKIVTHAWFRGICYDHRPVGAIMVMPNSHGDTCRAEIGYHLGYEQWGKGIVTEAVRLVCETVFRDRPHLERLEGYVDVENVASQRVLEKCGFVKEGVLRRYMMLNGKLTDMLIYSRLSTDPFPI